MLTFWKSAKITNIMRRTTVSVWVIPAAVRHRLTLSTTFCIHGWSSGAGYASLYHRRPRFRRRRSTCMEQSSSRSAPIPDIYYLHLKSHLFNLSFPSVWLYYWLYHWLFLYRALEAACAAYVSLNSSLLRYVTLRIRCQTDYSVFGGIYVNCKCKTIIGTVCSVPVPAAIDPWRQHWHYDNHNVVRIT